MRALLLLLSLFSLGLLLTAKGTLAEPERVRSFPIEQGPVKTMKAWMEQLEHHAPCLVEALEAPLASYLVRGSRPAFVAALVLQDYKMPGQLVNPTPTVEALAGLFEALTVTGSPREVKRIPLNAVMSKGIGRAGRSAEDVAREMLLKALSKAVKTLPGAEGAQEDKLSGNALRGAVFLEGTGAMESKVLEALLEPLDDTMPSLLDPESGEMLSMNDVAVILVHRVKAGSKEMEYPRNKFDCRRFSDAAQSSLDESECKDLPALCGRLRVVAGVPKELEPRTVLKAHAAAGEVMIGMKSQARARGDMPGPREGDVEMFMALSVVAAALFAYLWWSMGTRNRDVVEAAREKSMHRLKADESAAAARKLKQLGWVLSEEPRVGEEVAARVVALINERQGYLPWKLLLSAGGSLWEAGAGGDAVREALKKHGVKATAEDPVSLRDALEAQRQDGVVEDGSDSDEDELDGLRKRK